MGAQILSLHLFLSRINSVTTKATKEDLRSDQLSPLIERNYSDLFRAGAHRFQLTASFASLETSVIVSKGGVNQDRTFDVANVLTSLLCRSLGETISTLAYGAYTDDQGNEYIAKQEELLVYSTLAWAGYLVDIFS